MQNHLTVYSPYTGQLQQHHFFQSQTNDCGPCVIATINNALQTRLFHFNTLSQALNRYTSKRLPPDRLANSATFPWGMVRILRQLGFNARWRLWAKPKDLQRVSTPGLILVTITGQWSPLWAHYMLLVALDPHRGPGFINPALPQPEIDWRPQAQFFKEWNAFGRQLVEIRVNSHAYTDKSNSSVTGQ